MEGFIFSVFIISLIVPIIWYGYKIYQLDKPMRDWYNGNIPKNLHCGTYEDYLLYLYEKDLI